ncbi:hypothetical protein [Nitriliruptor alkaliphilus]|uniref:hypothetical protein n=1 Tax=Nitriliruptor alkaliphilus TaxID=427918 RepID=UPI000697822F|nr:hypothetical protein [Nitriliruptor alkaliphilus]
MPSADDRQHRAPAEQRPTTLEAARSVVFDGRFAGAVPGYANGGVIAGTVARSRAVGRAAVEVKLARPVPLETPLEFAPDVDQDRLCVNGEVLATAQVWTGPLPEPDPVSLSDTVGTEEVVAAHAHPAPGCFVCGPGLVGGLDLQPGRVRGRDLVATRWIPPDDLADGDGTVPAPIVWAALDCPSWYGAAGGAPALLGTIRARQSLPLHAGTEVVVTGWSIASEGRKTFAGSAIHAANGDLIAVASSIWIHPAERG